LLLFYFADREMLLLSGADRAVDRQWMIAQLSTDLRLLVLMLPLEDYAVIVPAHFRESPICREVVYGNIPFIEAGYLRLLRREPSDEAHLAKKQEAYKKVMHLPDYREAYFSGSDHGLRALHFPVESKNFATGERSLQMCVNAIRARARKLGYDQKRINELVVRIADAERDAFLWETTTGHITDAGLGRDDAERLQIRLSMSQSYVNAHRAAGITIPVGCGTVIPPFFGRAAPRHSNALSVRRFLEVAGLTDTIMGMSAADVVEFKTLPDVAACLEQVRTALDRSQTFEAAVRELQRSRAIQKLRKAARMFRQLSRLERKGETMKAIGQFRKDHPGETVFVMSSFPKRKTATRAMDRRINAAFKCIRSHLQTYGMTAVRADKKNYVAGSSNLLWDNVQVYLEACSYGIAVLDNLYAEQMNVNVAVEYGYMRAQGKPTLLLKDRQFTSIAADLLGQLWEEFDFEKSQTIRACLDRWMVALGKHKVITD